jgi:hypothetical protein
MYEYRMEQPHRAAVEATHAVLDVDAERPPPIAAAAAAPAARRRGRLRPLLWNAAVTHSA